MESTETTTSSESLRKSCTIATATERDLKQLGEMGQIFAEAYGQGMMFFKSHIFIAKMRFFMENRMGIVLCALEDFELRGAIAGVIYENVFDGEPCATELFWYVWPGAPKGTGNDLLAAFEEWAIRRKCSRVTMAFMVHNMPERLGPYYEKHGYTAFETHYVKKL